MNELHDVLHNLANSFTSSVSLATNWCRMLFMYLIALTLQSQKMGPITMHALITHQHQFSS